MQQLTDHAEETTEDTTSRSEPLGSAQNGAAFWRRERVRSILLIGLVVVLANCAYLFNVFNPNPIIQDSGLGVVVQHGLLGGQNNIDPNIGFTAQALGHRAAIDWLHGQIPWWNPYEGVGAPLAGEMQSSALFPLTAFNLLPGGQVFFRIALELCAGIATYLLLRRFTRSNLPAVIGGIGFALNGTFSWLFHAPGNPVAFLPLLLLGIEWAREGAVSGERRGWVLIAVSLALSLYAGFPETAFIDGVLAVVWLLVRMIGLPRRSVGSLVQSVALGGLVGALLAAPILVAFVDYIPYADIGGHNGSFANAHLGAGTALPSQIMPYLFGPIFGFSGQSYQLGNFWGNIGGFFGAAVSTLAIVGVVGRSYRSLRLALAAWTVVGLGRLVGVGAAVAVINVIPGFSTTAFYRYASPSWEMAILVLAAFGLDDILHRTVSRTVLIVCGLTTIGLCFIAWGAAESVLKTIATLPDGRTWTVVSLSWTFFVVFAIVALALLPDVSPFASGRFRRAALGTLVVVDIVAMFATPQFSAPHQSSVDTKPVSFLARKLGADRFYSLGPIAPNYGSYFGIASVGVNDLPVPKAYTDFITKHLDRNDNPLFFTGTTPANPAGPSPAQELVSHLSQYEAIGVKYVVLPGDEQLPASGTRLRQVFRDAYSRIVELPHPAPLFSAVGGDCSVHVTGEYSASVDCSKPSSIVYRELYMPGWSAQSGGRGLKVERHGPLFQSVELPAGRSDIAFSFAPPHSTLAIVAFFLGLACLVVAADRSRRRRRASEATPRSHRGGRHVRRRASS
jgi:hypothetical protein